MQSEVKWLENYLDEREVIPELDKCIHLINNWLCMNHYESKQLRLEEWNPTKVDAYSILCHILINCLIHREMTYQAMIGSIANDIRCNEQLDRIKTAAEVIALAYQCDLIVITKRSDTMFITTEFELDEDIPEFDKHQPENQPYADMSNQILGCRFKQHKKDTCLNHINTMNAVPLTLEWRVINELQDKPKKEETEAEEAWQDFVRRSQETYQNIGTDTFYLRHAYDTRGRTYCEGYYVTYQGNDFKKGIITLANKELI